MSYNFPRRNCVEQMSKGELAIREAVRVVEEMGCDVKLTAAVILLGEAQARVADFVDAQVPAPPAPTRDPTTPFSKGA